MIVGIVGYLLRCYFNIFMKDHHWMLNFVSASDRLQQSYVNEHWRKTRGVPVFSKTPIQDML